jgi:hypothetical protein
VRWHHIFKVNPACPCCKKFFQQAWVMLFKQRTHKTKEGMRVTELRCTTALPGKKGLIGITLWWWDITLKKGDGVIVLSQRQSREHPGYTSADNSDVLGHESTSAIFNGREFTNNSGTFVEAGKLVLIGYQAS